MSHESMRYRVRPRSCGLLIEEDSILLIQIDLPTRPGVVWMPPGGEIQYGETMKEALVREFREETGLEVETVKLVYIYEFVEEPFHAIEHYFLCRREKGTLETGRDPELPEDAQMIQDLHFFKLSQLGEIDVEPPFLKERLERDWRFRGLSTPNWISSKD